MSSPFIQSVRDHLRARNYSKRTEKTYIYWIIQFIRFHHMRHPSEMAETEIVQFLENLALNRNVTPSTQKTALNSLIYLYKKVLRRDSLTLLEFRRASKEKKLPVVLTRQEIRNLLNCIDEEYRLLAEIMYGSGLRLMEVCRLRVKDIDLEHLAIIVCEGKGNKQRVTTLSETSVSALSRQLIRVELLWREDCEAGIWDGVYLPFALELSMIALMEPPMIGLMAPFFSADWWVSDESLFSGFYPPM